MRRSCSRAAAHVSAATLGGAIIESMAPVLAHHKASGGPLGPIHEVHELVTKAARAAIPDVQCYAFGSAVVYGVHEPKSDVDFVALTPKDIADGMGLDEVSQQANGLQNQLLSRIAREVRRENPTWRVEEVKRTRVPVLRVKTINGDFDVTAHRRNGVRNSALLRSYFAQHNDARWLALAIKQWSKRTAMNGAQGFLTSYGFNILVIHYLRSIGMVNFVPLESADVSKQQAIPEGAPLVVPSDPAVIGELALGFLNFYRHELDHKTNVVSLSRPEVTTREQLNWTMAAEGAQQTTGGKVSYRLCIEDPYEINLNVGRNITAFRHGLFQKHLEKGLESGLSLVHK